MPWRANKGISSCEPFRHQIDRNTSQIWEGWRTLVDISGIPNGAEADRIQDPADPSFDQLVVLVESLLFVAPEPVAVGHLATALEQPIERVEKALAEMSHHQAQRGIRLQRMGQRFQLVTAPEAADAVERFLGLDLTTRLSAAALETLAIIAYRQPVTRAQIDELRGVSSDGVLRTLLHRGLIEQGERLETAGRPFQYQTTFDFLQYFGLQSLEDLPPLAADEDDPAKSASNGVDDSDTAQNEP